MSKMRGHIAKRSCAIHGDNGCEIKGGAGSITRVAVVIDIETIRKNVQEHYEDAQDAEDHDLAEYLGEALDALGNALDYLQAQP